MVVNELQAAISRLYGNHRQFTPMLHAIGLPEPAEGNIKLTSHPYSDDIACF